MREVKATGSVVLLVPVLCAAAAMLVPAGCAAPAIEGAKIGMLAFEGDYQPVTPLAPKIMADYKGFTLGRMQAAPVSRAEEDESEEDFAKRQETTRETTGHMADRMARFMREDTHLRDGGTPAVLINVDEIAVDRRGGVLGVALPKKSVSAKVTLADARTGKTLGVAVVSGETGSRLANNPRQMASIIARGTGRWIHENVEGEDVERGKGGQ